MSMLRMTQCDLNNKRVLIREDLNVPVHDGLVTSDARIQAAIPTIKNALDQGASVILMSHLGRPTEGQLTSEYSLLPIAQHLEKLLGRSVRLVTDYLSGFELDSGECVLLENVRGNPGEKKNDPDLARQYAALCDVFVMDAFGTAHRAQASTHGVAEFAPVACAGPLLCKELDALAQAFDNPESPVVAIVGGSKVSTKLTVLNALSKKVDQLIVGGGIANTFIAAKDFAVGQSLCEQDLILDAKNLMQQAQNNQSYIPVPTDVVVAQSFSADAAPVQRQVSEIQPNEMILDIGPNTITELKSIIHKAKTIIWNGPVGVFEFDAFSQGTRAIAQAIADSDAFSIAGGGDTLAAIEQFEIGQKISYISTGGGAFLEFLEGKTLPAVEILESRAAVSV